MAKKNDGLTPRQRQSQQIIREKALKKKRQAFLRKWGVIGGAAIAVLLAGSGIWVWKSGMVGRLAQNTVDGSYRLTARAGFTVQSLYLEGRNRTSMEDIHKALGITKGDPILRICLGDVRNRLEKIESVKSATVERTLPGTLTVRIVEREPVALWQHQGKRALVDDQGSVMNDIDTAQAGHMPLILGEDAPKHVSEVLALLAAEPDLSRRFVAATHIGGRRWNIRLSAGNSGNGKPGEEKTAIDIKLPETEPEEAWKKLADLQTRQHILDRDVKAIDLRVQGRLFIRLTPQDAPEKIGNIRDL